MKQRLVFGAMIGAALALAVVGTIIHISGAFVVPPRHQSERLTEAKCGPMTAGQAADYLAPIAERIRASTASAADAASLESMVACFRFAASTRRPY